MTFLIVIIIAVLLFFAAALYTYMRIFYVDRKRCSDPYDLGHFKNFDDRRDDMKAMVAKALALPCTDVYTESFDGYKLHARYYEKEPGAPIEIMFHGYRGNAVKDFCGGLPLGLDCGCNVILVDQRAHGESEGRCLSFGVLERRDVLSWVNFAVDKFGPDSKIILVGISMGAATVLMSTDLDFPANVKGVIADCPYSSPKKIILQVMENMHYPARLLYPFAKWGAKIYGHFDLEESAAEDAVKKAKLPLLLIHGQEDDFVPHQMSCDIYENYAAKKQFESFPVASHGMSYMADPVRYRNAAMNFVKRVTEN